MRIKFRVTIISLLVLAGCSTRNPQTSGRMLTVKKLPNMPVALAGMGLLKSGNDIVVAGGTGWQENNKFWNNKSWFYQIDKAIWREGAILPMSVGYPVTVALHKKTFLIGGEDGKDVLDSIIVLKENGKWEVVDHAPFKLTYAAGAANRNSIFIVGGTEKVADYANGNQSLWIGKLNDDGSLIWRKGPKFPGKANNLMSAACWKERFYVFGGYYSEKGEGTDSDEIYLFTEKDGWKKVGILPAPVRCLASVTIPKKGILIMGKLDADKNAEAYLFRPEEADCIRLGSLPVNASVMSACYDGENAYLAGGEDKPRHRIDSFMRLMF